MPRTTTLLLAAAVLTLAMAACSVMGYPDKQQGPGPCASGYWPDDRGCCPAIIQGKPYYRDSNKCYPVGGAKGVLYADSLGCYPDERGRYLAAQETCPKGRRCEASCIDPEPKYQWDNNSEDDREHHWMDKVKEDPAVNDKPQLPLDDKKGHHKPANNNNGGGHKKGGNEEGEKKKRPIDEHRQHDPIGKKGSQ